jgi:hypothetical protein
MGNAIWAVSAFNFPGKPRQLIEMTDAGEISVATSEPIIEHLFVLVGKLTLHHISAAADPFLEVLRGRQNIHSCLPCSFLIASRLLALTQIVKPNNIG